MRRSSSSALRRAAHHLAMGERWARPPRSGAPRYHSTARVAILVGLAASACDGPGEVVAGRLAVMRDSAGVQIVENRDPLWTADTRWTIDSAPSLTIGVEEGDPQREFFRLIDVRRLSDGRVAALNAGTSELRYFSPEGAYLCTSGREGAGPGEFEQASWLQLLSDDSLLVFSFGGGGRLSLIGPGGSFVRTLPIPRVPEVQYVRPNGMLSNGSMLLRSGGSYGMGMTSGTHSDSALLLIFDDATEVARIGPLPSNQSAVVASENRMTVSALVFGKSLITGFGTGLLYVGTNERYEISAHDTLGRLTRSIRLDRAPEPVTAAAIAHAESTRLASARSENARAMSKALFEQMDFPATMPFYAGILVDRSGNVWVARYDYLPGPRTWDVFNAEGQLLGAVQLPDGFSLRMISDGEIIGISRDELDVQRIQAFRISKPGDSVGNSSESRRPGDAPDDEVASAYRACKAP